MAAAAAVVDLTQEEEEEEVPVEFTLNMNLHPKPSISYGRGRGGPIRPFFNNAYRQQKTHFQQLTAAALGPRFSMYEKSVPLSLKIWCLMARPEDDFVGRNRRVGNLKPTALTNEKTMVPIRPDTDNLAKFILDALTGVLFLDDCQVVELHMLKMRDTFGLCTGRVVIRCQKFSNGWRSVLPAQVTMD